ncbi:MAG: SGNH/GDSL hydrolase family protein [bacterium]|nr:SGNH/GDSL hydrolase family protein [bacterium]
MKPHQFFWMVGKGIILFTLCVIPPVFAKDPPDPQRWQKDMQQFQEQDQQAMPPTHSVLFVGSSSIRLWDLKTSFPDKPYINRGFGGSHLLDSVYHMDQIVIPYRPRLIFLYAGDNDIAYGLTPQQVLDHFRLFAGRVHQSLPDTKIVYVSIKTSLNRWGVHEAMRATNQLIKNYCDTIDFLDFFDADTPLLDSEGKPDPIYFMEDQLHLNKKGYAIWAEAIQPFLVGF